MFDFVCEILGVNPETASPANMAFMRFAFVPVCVAVIGLYKTIITNIFNIFIRRG